MATVLNDDVSENVGFHESGLLSSHYHRFDEESAHPAARRLRARLKSPNNKSNRNEVRDRLESVREYLADPRPDPQWERMMVVLNILLDIFWIVASMAVFRFTDFYVRVLYDPKIDRVWLKYSTVAVCIDLAIAGYYIVYLSCIRGVAPELWDNHWRWGFPIATVLFFVAAITFTVAAWDVWWIFTPPILFLFFMGFITVVSYIPDFGPADLRANKKNTIENEDNGVSDTRGGDLDSENAKLI